MLEKICKGLHWTKLILSIITLLLCIACLTEAEEDDEEA